MMSTIHIVHLFDLQCNITLYAGRSAGVINYVLDTNPIALLPDNGICFAGDAAAKNNDFMPIKTYAKNGLCIFYWWACLYGQVVKNIPNLY